VLDHQQGNRPGNVQPPPAQQHVSADVVQALDRTQAKLDDIVKQTNLLTGAVTSTDPNFKKFRDPRFPDVSNPIETSTAGAGAGTGSGRAGQPGTLRPPGE